MSNIKPITFCPQCGAQTLKPFDLSNINDGEWAIGVDYGDGSLEYFGGLEAFECTSCGSKNIIDQLQG